MSKAYNEAHPNYCGDITICCLVNPANIVSCPTESEYNKMRTCAFLPIGKVEKDDKGVIIPLEGEYIEKMSKFYSDISQKDLDKFKTQELFDPNPKFIGRKRSDIRQIIFEI